ncbi:MAG: hypothetical protein ACREYE_28940 [Gammaproteobacteria bacterium]
MSSPHRARRRADHSADRLIRFHDVLAPNAKLRPAIIPSAAIDANAPAAEQGETPHPSPLTHRRLKRGCSSGYSISTSSSVRKSRPRLDDHRRPFDRLRTGILDPTVIAKILAHRRLPIRAPPRSPAQSL